MIPIKSFSSRKKRRSLARKTMLKSKRSHSFKAKCKNRKKSNPPKTNHNPKKNPYNKEKSRKILLTPTSSPRQLKK